MRIGWSVWGFAPFKNDSFLKNDRLYLSRVVKGCFLQFSAVRTCYKNGHHREKGLDGAVGWSVWGFPSASSGQAFAPLKNDKLFIPAQDPDSSPCAGLLNSFHEHTYHHQCDTRCG